MRTTRSANTKADRSKQTSRARPKTRYACFVSLPSGNQGSFPDEEGKTMKSSGISPVFPDETTEFDCRPGIKEVFRTRPQKMESRPGIAMDFRTACYIYSG